MNVKHYFLTVFMLVAFSVEVLANNYTNSTPAVQGYDVVSYQTSKRPIKGSGHYVYDYQGATYQFANEANLAVFKKDPMKYVPAYGGYCAYGVSVGKKFVGDPEVWRIVDGKLYLNLDNSIQAIWLEDVPGRIKISNTEWRKIKNKSPTSL